MSPAGASFFGGAETEGTSGLLPRRHAGWKVAGAGVTGDELAKRRRLLLTAAALFGGERVGMVAAVAETASASELVGGGDCAADGIQAVVFAAEDGDGADERGGVRVLRMCHWHQPLLPQPVFLP